MVVVSGSWVKNVATYPTPDSDDDMVIPTTNNNNVNNNNMSAKAVLICRPNSHPFQDRTLCLNQPVKIGRSIARARATSTNAIFDCKVLSRHHALLWYDCGKFFLQDTKSSNGTFVNNNRLSTSESEPHEVSSGDIVQFGVDVVENNRKVTHGCIIATLKLYLPDGKEAKASPSITEANRHGEKRRMTLTMMLTMMLSKGGGGDALFDYRNYLICGLCATGLLLKMLLRPLDPRAIGDPLIYF